MRETNTSIAESSDSQAISTPTAVLWRPPPPARGGELGLLLEPAACAVRSGHSEALLGNLPGLGSLLTHSLPHLFWFLALAPTPVRLSHEPLGISTQLLTLPPGPGADPPLLLAALDGEAGLASDAPELCYQGKVGGCDPPGPRVKADAALSAPGLCGSHPCTADQ